MTRPEADAQPLSAPGAPRSRIFIGCVYDGHVSDLHRKGVSKYLLSD